MTVKVTDSALEPWMRGTHTELDPLRRAVVHALEMTAEDAARWGLRLDEKELVATPHGLAPVAFHLRHIARSLDRLLTYAEDGTLDEEQLAALASEHSSENAQDAMAELAEAIKRAIERVRAIDPADYAAARGIGRKRLPTTVGGLLVHVAEHTQRHAGQIVTTAKLLLDLRGDSQSANTRELD